MENTVGKLIQRVFSAFEHGVQSDDFRLSEPYVYNILIGNRAKLARQRYTDKQDISSMYQYIECIEMIEAPLSECPCIPNNDCVTLKSKYPLPRYISGLDRILLNSVVNLHGNIKYDKTTFEQKKYNSGKKYSSSYTDYYIKNQYLYLTTLKGACVITLSGLFFDPIEAKKFPSLCSGQCKDCDCIDYNEMEFPIDGDLIGTLIEMTINELKVFLQTKNDKKNNTIEDE